MIAFIEIIFLICSIVGMQVWQHVKLPRQHTTLYKNFFIHLNKVHTSTNFLHFILRISLLQRFPLASSKTKEADMPVLLVWFDRVISGPVGPLRDQHFCTSQLLSNNPLAVKASACFPGRRTCCLRMFEFPLRSHHGPSELVAD